MKRTLAARVTLALLVAALGSAPALLAQQAANARSAPSATANSSAVAATGPRRAEAFAHVADSSAAEMTGGVQRTQTIPVTTVILALLILIVLILVL